jgi:signal transduction histidine kinase
VSVDIDQVIAELRGLADELAERSRRRDASDPLGGAARAALAEEVVSTVRHDMRNKLGSIRNAAFYLKRRVQQTELWTSDPRVSQFFALIDETVTDGTRMMDTPLGEGLRPARQHGRVSVRECIDVAAACTHLPERIRLTIAAGSSLIDVDRAEMALAVRCLLENAVEASPEGGTIDLTAREDGDCLVLTVTDTGSGIPAAYLESIFEPFASTKPGHAGVGLNMARRIARRQGGDVSVTPGPHGVAVTLVVPLAEPEDGPRTGVRGPGPVRR